MAIILNIDTAVDSSSVCLAQNGQSISFLNNLGKRDQVAWLHTAIQHVLKDAGLLLKDLNGIAVTIGPGSYTGLRVGLSAAKGLCYGLKIPLITIGTLRVMAEAVKEEVAELNCPLIDARRMEVFAAVFTKEMKISVEPAALIIDELSFGTLLATHRILFSGNGSYKLQKLIQHPNASFSNKLASALQMPVISEDYFNKKIFADLAYTEPLYLKEFYTGLQLKM